MRDKSIIKHFTTVQNLLKSPFLLWVLHTAALCYVPSMAGFQCLSEAVPLTPVRQHGSLAPAQCCELKLWLWRHVGGHSYALSTFCPCSSSTSLLSYSCTLHSDLWPSSVRHRGKGLKAQVGRDGCEKPNRLAGRSDNFYRQQTGCSVSDETKW